MPGLFFSLDRQKLAQNDKQMPLMKLESGVRPDMLSRREWMRTSCILLVGRRRAPGCIRGVVELKIPCMVFNADIGIHTLAANEHS